MYTNSQRIQLSLHTHCRRVESLEPPIILSRLQLNCSHFSTYKHATRVVCTCVTPGANSIYLSSPQTSIFEIPCAALHVHLCITCSAATHLSPPLPLLTLQLLLFLLAIVFSEQPTAGPQKVTIPVGMPADVRCRRACHHYHHHHHRHHHNHHVQKLNTQDRI